MNNSELLNQFDYIHIIIILISSVFGFIKGFSKSFSKTSALFYSGILAFFLTPHVIPIVNSSIKNILFCRYISFVISYLIVVVIFMLIISSNEEHKKVSIPSASKKYIGAFVGILRGFCISVGLCVFILTFEVQKEKISTIKSLKISSILFSIAEYWMPLSNETTVTHKIAIAEEVQKKDKIAEIKTHPKEERVCTKYSTKEEITTEEKYKTIKYIANFFANIFSGLNTIEDAREESHYTLPQKTFETTNEQQVIRADYGCMSLLKARTRRRAERKKELIEKDLLREMEFRLHQTEVLE